MPSGDGLQRWTRITWSGARSARRRRSQAVQAADDEEFKHGVAGAKQGYQLAGGDGLGNPRIGEGRARCRRVGDAGGGSGSELSAQPGSSSPRDSPEQRLRVRREWRIVYAVVAALAAAIWVLWEAYCEARVQWSVEHLQDSDYDQAKHALTRLLRETESAGGIRRLLRHGALDALIAAVDAHHQSAQHRLVATLAILDRLTFDERVEEQLRSSAELSQRLQDGLYRGRWLTLIQARVFAIDLAYKLQHGDRWRKETWPQAGPGRRSTALPSAK